MAWVNRKSPVRMYDQDTITDWTDVKIAMTTNLCEDSSCLRAT